MLRYFLIWLGVAVVIAAVIWLRMDWIESASAAHACLAGLHAPGCWARGAAIVAFQSHGVAVAAVIGGILALAWKHPLSASLAIFTGVIALVLYSPEVGAVASLVGALRLLRLQLTARARQGNDRGRGKQHVAQCP